MPKLMIKEIVKVITISSFFFVFIAFFFFLFGDRQIKPYLSLINSITYSSSKNTKRDVKFNAVSKRLDSYPSFGSRFATIRIDKINLNLAVYHGDTLDILKHGVGHLSGSYFPGEGGGIVFDAHNSYDYFGNLPKLSNGDKIVVNTDYGTFTYEVSGSKVINKNDLSSLNIMNHGEMLVLYTCYPVNTPGLIPNRYVVYAKLVGESFEGKNS